VGTAIVVAVAVTVGAFGFGVHPATATLAGVAPTDGAGLATPPAEVSLIFTGGVPEPLQIHVTVADADGVAVTAGEPELVGQRMVVPVVIREAGVYLVGYHVRLANGYQATGVTRFTVATGTSATDSAAGATGAAGAAAALDPAATDGSHAHVGDDPLSLVLVGLDVLMVLGLVALMLRRPRQDRTRKDVATRV
jgi:methionine-rich copper-binding protein CopC